MSKPFLELPPDLAGRLLRFSELEFVRPGLWRVAEGELSLDLERLAGRDEAVPGPLWLRLDGAEEPPQGCDVRDISLPPEVRFRAPAGEAPLEAVASLVVPGDLVAAEAVVLYRPAGADIEVGDADALPLPGARVRLLESEGLGLLEGSPRLRCQVRDEHGTWGVEVVADPERPGEALALCPLCDSPADRWYRCAHHGPHCSAHRKVCRSCRRGECAACFSLSCGDCGNPLCPACAQPCSCGDHGACTAHRSTCSECHGVHCTACAGGTCCVGETPLCQKCAGACTACGRTVRTRLLTACFTCGTEVCPNCSEPCHLDGRAMCPAHHAACGECGKTVCEGHREICLSCGGAHCRGHVSTCATCARTSCAACLKPGSCKQCRALKPLEEELEPRVERLGQGQPWSSYSSARAARGPSGWLLSLHVGLTDYRVGTDAEFTRVESVHRRGWVQRVLGRG